MSVDFIFVKGKSNSFIAEKDLVSGGKRFQSDDLVRKDRNTYQLSEYG